MKIKIKKLSDKAVIPTYSHEDDGCFDLTAIDKVYDPANNVIEYSTGLAIEIPEDHVGLIFPRSSVYKTCHMLANCTGVIDCGYTGEIKFMFRLVSRQDQYEVGDRIGQMMIIPRPKCEFEVVDELSSSERNTGGFGSTNDKEEVCQ